MAKLRRNHTKNRNSSASFVRILGFLVAVGLMMYFLYSQMTNLGDDWDEVGSQETEVGGGDAVADYLPTSSTGDVIRHQHYTLSYSEEHEQAEWVAYLLTKESIRKPNVKRADRFNPDPMVPTRSAHHRDYSNSGYTRGHLAPAGDMAFDKEAMQESFYMSNMSPQLRAFNGGIWRELEECVRDWAYDNDEIYVVTGPVLSKGHLDGMIGNTSKVAVPKLFYKVILDVKVPSKKAIAFLMPNELSEQPIADFAVSIDSIENLTGIDFFAGAMDQDLEQSLESKYNMKQWRVSKKRYQVRVDHWNRR